MAIPRFHCDADLVPGASIDLPPGAARHVQVLRLQPGATITLFGGPADTARGGEYAATVSAMGRQTVQVLIGSHIPIERESARRPVLAIGMPANERMDWLVEKATEIGVAQIQPLMTQRSVVRLDAQRGLKKLAHWRSIAISACEQCGGNRVPLVGQPLALSDWLRQQRQGATADRPALVLSLRAGSEPLRQWVDARAPATGEVLFLCGPEGGLSEQEEALAMAAGFVPVSLGPRVLRSETAALMALTLLS